MVNTIWLFGSYLFFKTEIMQIAEISVSYSNNNNERIKINNSQSAYEVILENWNLDLIEFQEIVKIVLLNNSNEVLGIFELSKGGSRGSVVDIKIMLSVALKAHSTALIMVHNHPSGTLKPSNNDVALTKKVKKACKMVDLTLLDHLIITKNGYYSFSDENTL